MCASYNDTILYEVAAVFHHPTHILPPETDPLNQYVADNADINENTLDGHNTLHIMEITQIVTPESSVLLEEPIERINKAPPSKEFAAVRNVPIQIYRNDGVVGYSKMNVKILLM